MPGFCGAGSGVVWEQAAGVLSEQGSGRLLSEQGCGVLSSRAQGVLSSRAAEFCRSRLGVCRSRLQELSGQGLRSLSEQGCGSSVGAGLRSCRRGSGVAVRAAPDAVGAGGSGSCLRRLQICRSRAGVWRQGSKVCCRSGARRVCRSRAMQDVVWSRARYRSTVGAGLSEVCTGQKGLREFYRAAQEHGAAEVLSEQAAEVMLKQLEVLWEQRLRSCGAGSLQSLCRSRRARSSARAEAPRALSTRLQECTEAGLREFMSEQVPLRRLLAAGAGLQELCRSRAPGVLVGAGYSESLSERAPGTALCGAGLAGVSEQGSECVWEQAAECCWSRGSRGLWRRQPRVVSEEGYESCVEQLRDVGAGLTRRFCRSRAPGALSEQAPALLRIAVRRPNAVHQWPDQPDAGSPDRRNSLPPAR